MSACTGEDIIFENGEWWQGHWQKIDDVDMYFSSGQKRVGPNEIVTAQYFFSTKDTILQNFHVEELVDSDHRNRNKIIFTNENTFLKIQEIDESNIEVFGPSETLEEIDSIINTYVRLPINEDPPIPDSLLNPI